MKRFTAFLLVVLILATGCRGRLRQQITSTPTSQPPATTAPQQTEATTAPATAVADAPTAAAPAPTEAAAQPTPAAPTAGATNVAATPTSPPAPTFDTVPADYNALYETLDQNLDTFEENVLTQAPAVSSTFWSGELTPASGNLGPALLEPRSMQLVREYLDGLRGMGLTGVGVQISYPLLVPDYPDADKYLSFYQQVVREAHQRGFKVLIETSPVFAGTEFSNVSVDYRGLTKEAYFQQRKDMVLLIASEIRPDYLSLTHEPTTEVALTGVRMNVDDFVNFVKDTLNSLDRSAGILYGAGNGTWEDSTYIDRYIQETSVDFINLHIYPVANDQGNQLEIAANLSQQAINAGKRLVIGETWLYKATTQELAQPLGKVSLGEYYARDPYSFWQPLDIHFIQSIVDLGRTYNYDFISFFWSRYFFGYVNYNDVPKNINSTQLFRLANQAAYANMQQGQYSYTGQAYSQMISQP
ncbi:MAG: hypothetical protein KC418_00420 [Anaerolineales bacterium]|nr:hypothetical protein [Anaerolineales bacterium]MCB8951595.1 hypothetical protein [Ardenticatenales bacterium]